MKILKDSITTLAAEGRMTLQVPDSYICFKGSTPKWEEVPDEWFCRLCDRTPAVGRQDGILFLTQQGWNANKAKIKLAFEGQTIRNLGTWEDFEKIAKDHFKRVQRAWDRKFDLLESHLEDLKDFVL